MRFKTLKINGQPTEALLCAGGPGFKIYSASGINGWVLEANRRVGVVYEGSTDYLLIGRYVTLKYQPIEDQPSIKSEFTQFLAEVTNVQTTKAN